MSMESVDMTGPSGLQSISRRRAHLVLAVLLVVTGMTVATAMLRTSTTFDEIVFVGGGVRGFAYGDWDVVPDHPPLMQYIYALPVWLSGPSLPDESEVHGDLRNSTMFRYIYARAFYWVAGNDPERVTRLSRAPAVLFTLALVFVTFLYTRRRWGDAVALLAATIVAFMPDVLAHGGVAYSDVPSALAILGGIWATDEAIRRTCYRRALLAGGIAGLAVCVKINAGMLLPVAIGIVLMEALARRQAHRADPAAVAFDGAAWGRRIAVMAVLATLAAYLVLVVVHRGDFTLAQFRWGLGFRYWHMSTGHGVPAYLLGKTSVDGWWYFFPVAFLYKTSAGFHVLAAIAVAALASQLRRAPERVLRSGLRGPVLGIVFFGAALLNSSLNIGFRYALPLLPLLGIVTAVGCACAWNTGARLLRPVMAVALVWAIVFPLTYYPHFLGFISEYGPSRDRNHEILLDSSLDWGQGLIELRDFMHRNDIPVVYLSYFGSALPEGYGIRYVPLQSTITLPSQPPTDVEPEWYAVSATNLHGMYLQGDPFAMLRAVKPDAVLAHSIYMYRIPSEEVQ
jgi:4-amino-4-deoxy-L-arabinose transferase-like glycosyltransferase